MNSRQTVAASLLILSAIVAGFASFTVATPAVGQSGDRDDSLDLVTQTMVVTDEPVVFRLRVPSRIKGRRLEVRVHSPVTDPDELRAAFDEPPTDSIISLFSVPDLSELIVGSDHVLSIVLPDEEIYLILRQEPGALPVVIDLVDKEGIIDTIVTAVIVDDGKAGEAIHLGFLADGQSPLSHNVDQTIDIDIDATVARLTELDATRPGPALVQFSPETLTALANQEVSGSLATITTIADLLQDDDLYTRPWVDLDEEAWRLASETARVLDQYSRGHATVEMLLGRSPSGIAALDRDATQETLGLLRSAGVTGAIVDANQIDPLDLKRADNRPLQMVDANNVQMLALVVSAAFEAHLDQRDPELAAAQMFAELSLLSDHVSQPRGFLVDLDTINRLSLDRLLEHRALLPELSVSTVKDLLALPPARDASGRVLRVSLIGEEAPDVSDGATDLRLAESILDSYASMVAPADAPIVPLRELLHVAISDQFDTEERRQLTNAVVDAVADGTTGFKVVSDSRITLATRTAELPLRLENNQPLPITVVVELRAAKILFPDGNELTLTLDPGITEISVPVKTLASGDARISVAVSSPDRQLDLASGIINVRSTAVSGLGLVVTLIAFLVLAAWWTRTIRRIKRRRLAANLDPAPATEGTPS